MSFPSQPLNSLFDVAAKRKGADILFADETERCSGELAAHTVNSLAGGLSLLDVRRKTRVAFLCDSSVRHVLVFFACLKLGAIPCALHIRSTAAAIAETLEWLDARLLIIDGRFRQSAEAALALSTSAIPVIVLDRGVTSGNGAGYDDMVGSRVSVPDNGAGEVDEPAMIILSSGTTGKPKGIVHSQRTLYASAQAGRHVFGHIGAGDSVILAMSPSFAAWNHVALPYLAGRARIVFNRGFDAELYISTLGHENITDAALVPTAWRRVFAALSDDADLPSLRKVFFAGEAGTREFIRLVERKLPAVEIRSAYLSSEGGDGSACVAHHDMLTQSGVTTGKPVPGADIRIIDPDGGIDDVLTQGETGEIAVTSASVALGYWKDRPLTGARFVSSWWRSGDLGCLDDDGNLNILGRTDNMIISGGLKLHAEEVEAVLLQHPDIRLAAVVGVPDGEWGQRVEAHVVAENDIQAEDILRYCRDNELLAAYKLPRRIHFRDTLPTGSTGKIYRRGLLEDHG